jgi:2-(1,2-epoxy-1,2-dihydrophenyl)acetyl-CoA isomerase
MSVYQELLRQGEGATERFVDVERRGDSAVVTLNEPERLNVLSAPLVVQTKAALVELAADRRFARWCSPAADEVSARAAT